MIIISKDKFMEWMKGKGYSEYTHDGLPSTIFQYCYLIERVMDREKIKSWSELTPHLRSIIKCYTVLNINQEKKYWGKEYPAVANTLQTLEWYLLENWKGEYLKLSGLN